MSRHTSSRTTTASKRIRRSANTRADRRSADDLLAWWCSRCDLQPAPTLAVVVAHPDDEVIGAGIRIAARPPRILMQVTDGAPRDGADVRRAGCTTRAEYARTRSRERDRAAGQLGLARNQIVELGVCDQEAAFALAPLARRCVQIFREHHVDVVVTHPYEGGHPDHDATAFVVHAACAMLLRAGAPVPVILEMTSYHLAGGRFASGRFLPASGDASTDVPLSAIDLRRKRQLYDCYASQRHVLGQFPIGTAERFRIAPAYDFTRPPHAGPLHYERHAWGMTAGLWCALASAAVAELGVRG